jgi:EAL domain-containing protein (putative c-di-GMP-specific phosphodiesterase class I)
VRPLFSGESLSTPIAKPVARGPTPPAAPESEAVTAESLGWQLRSALPPMRLHSVSLYNNDADVLWLSEGALGPDEHSVVMEAIEHLKEEKGQLYHELGMEDGRIAIFLGIRGPRGDLAGTVMILADMKTLADGTMERILTVPVKTLMQKMAVFLRKQYPQTADTGIVAAIPTAPAAASAPTATPKVVGAAPAAAAKPAANSAKPIPVLVETLAPSEVDTILTLELVEEPAPAAVEKPAEKTAEKNKGTAAASWAGKGSSSPASGGKGTAARGAPVVKAVATTPAAKDAHNTKDSASAKDSHAGKESAGRDLYAKAPAASAAPARTPSAKGVAAPSARGNTTAANTTQPAAAPAPSAEIEVLAFDADITISSARPVIPGAPVSLPEGDVLPFDANIEIPTAHPAPVAQAADIEVLDFDAELTMPPNAVLAKAAHAAAAQPESKPAAPAAVATPSAPEAKYDALAAFDAGLTHSAAAAKSATPATAETKSSGSGKPAASAQPAAKAASSSSAPSAPARAEPAAKSNAPASAQAGKVATPASSSKSAASAATVSVPVIHSTSSTTTNVKVDEEPLLISDTAPVKKLDAAAVEDLIEPVPASPPPPALTVAETATDLMLFVQELIKLRSSGRTRRYEVLARSMRDAGRNEVPTAFVSEAARGRDGAALDALVLERLLQWLGQHGETIWDSEPASFSVNLSIGALEEETFTQKIAQGLEQYNVPAEYVGFEISEFACVQCRPAVERFIAEIEKLGCFLVIDNFSFDSNMFEFLGSKALRHVKIDPKLTTVAMKEKLPQALVVAILQACKVLGVHCVAKRIDGQASLQWLTAVGCDFAQSFQLEKPAPIDRLVTGKSIKALRE